MRAAIAIPTIPAGHAPLTSVELDQIVGALRTWSDETSTRLLDVESELVKYPNVDTQDHTLAFVVWKAIDSVIAEVAGASNGFGTPAALQQRLQPLRNPVNGNDGSPVAKSVADAMAIVGALVGGVERAMAEQGDAMAMASAITDSLAKAAPLVKALDMRAGEYAELSARAAKLGTAPDPTAVRDVSGRAMRMLHDLQESARERDRLLQELGNDARLIDDLRELETRAREVSAQASAKVAGTPRLGIPSVAALGSEPDTTSLTNAPWPSARAVLMDRSTKLSRAKAAFEHIITANEKLLDERHELRQVLDAYRAKGMASRVGEVPEVGVAYERARTILWAAPCDLVAGRAAVADYQAIVEKVRTQMKISVKQGGERE